jgi:hypothetical protein
VTALTSRGDRNLVANQPRKRERFQSWRAMAVAKNIGQKQQGARIREINLMPARRRSRSTPSASPPNRLQDSRSWSESTSRPGGRLNVSYSIFFETFVLSERPRRRAMRLIASGDRPSCFAASSSETEAFASSMSRRSSLNDQGLRAITEETFQT